MPDTRAQIHLHRTLGPISDLERYLPEDWWQSFFNSVYLQTDGDVFENAANTRADVDMLLAASGMTPDQSILDLCCGQGRHSLELARRGFGRVTGIDGSDYLIRLARERAKDANLSVTFQVGDARLPRIPVDRFDCACLMGNSFGYFDHITDDLAVLQGIHGALRPGGILVLDIMAGDWLRENFEPRSWEWIDASHFVCRERMLSSDGDRLISREVVTHAEHGVIDDRFYAVRLYSRERISALLQEAGFERVDHYDTMQAQSDRNQDLGMMQNRFLMTGRMPRRSRWRRTAADPVMPVTVLLGDPRLPDTVKLEGRYNPEDLETVSRLRAALAQLGDYDFSFVDDHEHMLETLRGRSPPLVFNLCDEGFHNEATKELHIAALLEMLGLPYTGAGPACLAMCYDKAVVRAVAAELGIPVPLEIYVAPQDVEGTVPEVFPAFIKPALGDNSLGITRASLVSGPEQAAATLRSLHEILPDRPLLLQEFLSGAEYTVGIIGNPGSSYVLPILEVDYSGLVGVPPILCDESKWHPDSPYWTDIKYRPADLKQGHAERLIAQSAQLFGRLGCRDYARFDYRADGDGHIKLLEVNPNPGWCRDGKMSLMAEMAGLSYIDMIEMILDAARRRLRFVANASDLSAA